DPEIIAKRTKRRLEELERSNFAEPRESLADTLEDEEISGRPMDRSRETISLRNDGKQRKKSNAAVRAILLYRKNFNTLLEEAHLEDDPGPNYLTAVAPPPTQPARIFCQVCGYWGLYTCQKCGQHYCSIPCRGTHNDTGCERRLIA
ncbi:hypothetical protein M407DRAFT_126991, partial [Tulasnella calospora MUT 4182]